MDAEIQLLRRRGYNAFQICRLLIPELDSGELRVLINMMTIERQGFQPFWRKTKLRLGRARVELERRGWTHLRVYKKVLSAIGDDWQTLYKPYEGTNWSDLRGLW